MALSIQGTPGAAAATTITMPTHAAGDVLVIVAYKDGATSIPTVPAAGGTVPTWNTIDGPTGANTNAMVACWATATASNHTSGTWTGATGLFVIVYRGQRPGAPIGGHAQAGSTGANTCLAPSITLTKTDGTSAILHVGGVRNVTAWNAMGAGYTNRANVATEIRGATKDTTTSDGSQSLVPTNASSGSGYRAQTIEIVVAADITKTAGVTASTETAQALSKTQAAQSKTVTPKVETDAAQALAKTQQAQSKTVTPKAETDVAVALTKTQAGQTKTLGIATSANTALPLDFDLVANDIIKSLGAAASTETSQALARTVAAISRTVAQALETDAAQHIASSQAAQPKTVAAAVETGSAQTLSTAQQPQTKNLAAATSVNAAQALTTSQTANSKTIGAATATEAPVSLTFTNAAITRTLGVPVESDQAMGIGTEGNTHVSLEPAITTSTSLPVTFTIQAAQSLTLTASSELDTATHLTIEGAEFGDPVAGIISPVGTYGHVDPARTGRVVR